ALNEALQCCVGNLDFSAFRASDCTAKSTIRRIERIAVTRDDLYPEALVLDFWGEGFLKNMIRNITGTAVEIAIGRLEADTFLEAFKHCDRTRVGQCAPAHALTLQRVFYNPDEWKTAINSKI
ncbi:MAG: hypothetical protein ACO3A4_06315, partial [Silvanigrellaceae bacterium]